MKLFLTKTKIPTIIDSAVIVSDTIKYLMRKFSYDKSNINNKKEKMKQKVSKRILSMLLAVVMIIGFVPTFNLTVLAGAVEADTLAGKTVITKVELTVDMPTKYHDQMRGYDAGGIA